MPAENEIGDLIATLRLDDSAYKAQIKETLKESVNAVDSASRAMTSGWRVGDAILKSGKQIEETTEITRKHGRQVLSTSAQIKIINAAAQEAHQRFGVMANAVTGASTTLRLLGLESGFAYVEVGRMILYLGRATTSAGGLAKGVDIVHRAIKGFIVTIGPVGWTLAGLAAAYAIYTKATEESTEAIKANKDAHDRKAETYLNERDAMLDWRVAQGEISELDKRLILAERHGASRSELASIAQQFNYEQQIAEKKLNDLTLDRVHSLQLETSILQAEGTAYDLIADKSERIALMVRDRVSMLKEMGLEFGGMKPSDFMSLADPRRPLQLFRERAQALRASAQESGGGFGITTQLSSGFRFGPGAFGSVIGQQTEQGKTNDELRKVNKTLEKEYGELRKISDLLAGTNDGAIDPSSVLIGP